MSTAPVITQVTPTPASTTAPPVPGNDAAIAGNLRFCGQIKFFDRDRGFGFVTRLADKIDYFVHFNDIKPSQKCWNVLFEGEYVEFGIRAGPNGFQASDITGINRGSLLCEHNFQPNKPKKTKKHIQKTEKPAEDVVMATA